MSKYTLIQIQGNQQTETGLGGKTVVQAQARTIYRLRDETGAQPHKLALWRRGQDLVLEVQGAVVATLQGFYAAGQDAAQAPHYLLDTGVPGDPWIVTGRAPQQKISAAEDLVWRLDDDVVNVQLSPEQLRQVWAQSEVQPNLGDKRYTGDDHIAPSNGQVVNGTAEPGTMVEVRDGAGNLIGTAGPVGPDGNWTLVPARPLPDDTPLSATATDLAGNTRRHAR